MPAPPRGALSGGLNSRCTDRLGLIFPLYAVQNLLCPREEVIELVGRGVDRYGHRLTLLFFEDHEAYLLVQFYPERRTRAVRGEKEDAGASTDLRMILRQLGGGDVDLLPLNAADGRRLWRGGVEPRMVLDPGDQVFGGGLLRFLSEFVRVEDAGYVQEDEQAGSRADPETVSFLGEGHLPPVLFDLERESGLELFCGVFAFRDRTGIRQLLDPGGRGAPMIAGGAATRPAGTGAHDDGGEQNQGPYAQVRPLSP